MIPSSARQPLRRRIPLRLSESYLRAKPLGHLADRSGVAGTYSDGR